MISMVKQIIQYARQALEEFSAPQKRSGPIDIIQVGERSPELMAGGKMFWRTPTSFPETTYRRPKLLVSQGKLAPKHPDLGMSFHFGSETHRPANKRVGIWGIQA